MIPDATPETMAIFQDCMKTDAFFKSALPYSCLSSFLAYLVLPKTSGMAKPFVTGLIGISMYVFGKITYTPVCYRKAFGTRPITKPIEKRKQLQNTDDIESFAQDQEKYSIHFDNVTEEKSVWDNLDTQSESNTNEFYDATDNLQDEKKNESQEKQKKRVTYNDLWIQYRKQEMKNQFDDIEKYKVQTQTSKSLECQQNKLPKESAIPEGEFDEKNTWD